MSTWLAPMLPDPFRSWVGMKTRKEEQQRQVNRSLAKDKRALVNQKNQCVEAEKKALKLIKLEDQRAQRNPSQAKSIQANMRTLAREIVNSRKQLARLTTMEAQLNSIGLQVSQASSVSKIQGHMMDSTKVMKQVNTVTKLPELTGTMRELEQEMVKAETVQEMTEDALPDDNLAFDEDEEVDAEIDKVLGEVLKTPRLPETHIGTPLAQDAEPLEEDQEATLAQMRGRLEALKS